MFSLSFYLRSISFLLCIYLIMQNSNESDNGNADTMFLRLADIEF